MEKSGTRPEKAGRMVTLVLGQGAQQDALIFMWQTDCEAKQSTRRVAQFHERHANRAYIIKSHLDYAG